jgi:hypothetical protein
MARRIKQNLIDMIAYFPSVHAYPNEIQIFMQNIIGDSCNEWENLSYIIKIHKFMSELRILEDSFKQNFISKMLDSANKSDDFRGNTIFLSLSAPYLPRKIINDVFTDFCVNINNFSTPEQLQINSLLVPYLDVDHQVEAMERCFSVLDHLLAMYRADAPIAIDTLCKVVGMQKSVELPVLFSTWDQFVAIQVRSSNEQFLLALWATLPISLHLGGSSLAVAWLTAVSELIA